MQLHALATSKDTIKIFLLAARQVVVDCIELD